MRLLQLILISLLALQGCAEKDPEILRNLLLPPEEVDPTIIFRLPDQAELYRGDTYLITWQSIEMIPGFVTIVLVDGDSFPNQIGRVAAGNTGLIWKIPTSTDTGEYSFHVAHEEDAGIGDSSRIMNITDPNNTPEDSLTLFGWCDEDNFQGIGSEDGGEIHFTTAARFTPSDLEEHVGQYLHAIRFFTLSAEANLTAMVWQGSSDIHDPGILVFMRPMCSFNRNQWNIVSLDEPLIIDGNQEIWIGYECDVTSGYVAGTDAGPVVSNRGDLVYINDVWQTLSGDVNWMLQAVIMPNFN